METASEVVDGRALPDHQERLSEPLFEALSLDISLRVPFTSAPEVGRQLYQQSHRVRRTARVWWFGRRVRG